jgi:Fe-S-cluster-containing hydrogenase component 2
MEMANDVATVNNDRCIGCGNCVVNCTSDAIRLQKKDEELLPPPNAKALYMNIMLKKGG